MDPDAFKKYLTDRYEDQVGWYSKKALANKSRYQIFQWALIICSSIVPVLVTLESGGKIEWIWTVTVPVSVLVAIGTAGIKMFNFQENWINYRTTVEKLVQEKFLFDTGVGAYSQTKEKMSLFVERVESIISGENVNWLTVQKTKEGST